MLPYDYQSILDDPVRRKLASEMTHTGILDPTRGIRDWWSGMNTLQKVGMSPVGFPVTDIAGLAGDIQMYRESPETRGPLNYALSGLSLLPFIPGITAFHGTPHRFPPTDKNPLGEFDVSKAGDNVAGGDLFRGHGIYLAENRKVGESYMWPKGDGHLYEVDLPDSRVDKMLEWDAPLSDTQQGQMLRELLGDEDKAAILETVFGPSSRQHPEMIESFDLDGGMVYDGIAKILGSQKAASEYLGSIGIPGIKFWDKGSREAGKGTRNFVVFDPSIAKITGKK